MTPDPNTAAEQAIRRISAGPLFEAPEYLEEIDSTNRYLADAARAGAPEGAAVLADRQTAGRGRLGRRWLDVPGGSVLCSMLFRPPLEPGRWHLIGWAVAVAARQAIVEVTGVDVEFKWPNDLVVADRKLAGVLGETVPPSGLVVGIGVNCNWPSGRPPEEIASLATSLERETHRPVEVGELARRLLAEVSKQYLALLSGGEAALASAYRRRLSTIGRLVSVELPTETFVGRALDLDDAGRLLVDVGMCTRTIEAGDVVHLRAAGYLG